MTSTKYRSTCKVKLTLLTRGTVLERSIIDQMPRGECTIESFSVDTAGLDIVGGGGGGSVCARGVSLDTSHVARLKVRSPRLCVKHGSGIYIVLGFEPRTSKTESGASASGSFLCLYHSLLKANLATASSSQTTLAGSSRRWRVPPRAK